MDWNRIGRWVLLVGSLALGLLAGTCGYWIFEAKVPAAMQTSLLTTETRIYYLGSGALLGFAIFGWTMLGIRIAARSALARARREDGAK